MRTSNALQKLMKSGCEGERTLRHESAFVDGLPRLVLTRLADERRASVKQLREATSSSGALPECAAPHIAGGVANTAEHY